MQSKPQEQLLEEELGFEDVPGLLLATERKQDGGSPEHITAHRSLGAISNLCAQGSMGVGLSRHCQLQLPPHPCGKGTHRLPMRGT